MKSKYQKLEKVSFNNHHDYLESVLIENMPEVVKENSFTLNFFKALQKILGVGFATSEKISTYFKF